MSMINKAIQVFEEDMIPKMNLNIFKIMIMNPRHKSQHFTQTTYQPCFEQIQYLTYILKTINYSALWSQNQSFLEWL